MRPFLGYGVGLRPIYVEAILAENPPIDWFEILTENYLVPGGKPLSVLDRIGERYPLVMHGVSLSIGSTDPLDVDYLHGVKRLAQRAQPEWISDHLCWTGVDGVQLHDLMPLPYTEEALAHVSERIARVQDFLGRPLLMENVSSYVEYEHSTMSEWEFLAELCRRSDCRLLLDINNIYVSAVNHGFSPLDFLDGIPSERVWQFHLAGHSRYQDYLIDTHDQPVAPEVWSLYQEALRRFGPVSTMIERDDNFPAFSELLAELAEARRLGCRQLDAVA